MKETMFLNNSDKTWQEYGEIDPYYGVLSTEEYRRANLTEKTKQAFFQSGSNQIDQILHTIHEHLDPTFQPRDALDFGCGVGRLTIPLAKICRSATGVDISGAMLEEAQRNSSEQKVSNAAFVLSDDTLSRLQDTYDFITSFIVFQHIPVKRGEVITRRLIELLDDGGVGVLHFTYANKRPMMQRINYSIYKWFPALYALRLMTKRMPVQPLMQTNEYNLNRLMIILQEAGCDNCCIRFTNHSHLYAVFLLFQKNSYRRTLE